MTKSVLSGTQNLNSVNHSILFAGESNKTDNFHRFLRSFPSHYNYCTPEQTDDNNITRLSSAVMALLMVAKLKET